MGKRKNANSYGMIIDQYKTDSVFYFTDSDQIPWCVRSCAMLVCTIVEKTPSEKNLFKRGDTVCRRYLSAFRQGLVRGPDSGHVNQIFVFTPS